MKKHNSLSLLAPFLFLLAASACHPTEKEQAPDILVANLDTATSPASDFFAYANNGWISKTPIPPEERGWGIGQLVQKDIYDRLRKISETAAAQSSPAGSVSQQIGELWSGGMDSADIDRQGLSPLNKDMDSINNIHNLNDLLRITAGLHKKGISALFSDQVGQDDKNSDLEAYQWEQGGLGMPNRDYYFNTDEKTTKVRNAYKDYVFKTFRQLGRDSLAALLASNGVFQLESRLAKASRKLADLERGRCAKTHPAYSPHSLVQGLWHQRYRFHHRQAT